jgi:hypothetical protein
MLHDKLMYGFAGVTHCTVMWMTCSIHLQADVASWSAWPSLRRRGARFHCSIEQFHYNSSVAPVLQGHSPVEPETPADATFGARFEHEPRDGSAWGARGRQPDWSTSEGVTGEPTGPDTYRAPPGMQPGMQEAVFNLDGLEHNLPAATAYDSETKPAPFYSQPKDSAARPAVLAYPTQPKQGENQLHTLFPPQADKKSSAPFNPAYPAFAQQEAPQPLPQGPRQASPRPQQHLPQEAPAEQRPHEQAEAQPQPPQAAPQDPQEDPHLRTQAQGQQFEAAYGSVPEAVAADAAPYMRKPPKEGDFTGQEQRNKPDGLDDSAESDRDAHAAPLGGDPNQHGMPGQHFGPPLGQELPAWSNIQGADMYGMQRGSVSQMMNPGMGGMMQGMPSNMPGQTQVRVAHAVHHMQCVMYMQCVVCSVSDAVSRAVCYVQCVTCSVSSSVHGNQATFMPWCLVLM